MKLVVIHLTYCEYRLFGI